DPAPPARGPGHARHRRCSGRGRRVGAGDPAIHGLFAAAQGPPRAGGRRAAIDEPREGPMSTREPLSPETRALLERERELPSVPAAQKARAIARARAALAASGAPKVVPTRARPGKRWVAAAAALLASAAVGAAAYEIRARLAQPPHVAP